MSVGVPEMLKEQNFRLTAVKRYHAFDMLVEQRIIEGFNLVNADEYSTHFVEIQDKLLSKQVIQASAWEGDVIKGMNEKFDVPLNPSLEQKFAVLMLGNSAPGGNNIFDGLLKFQLLRRNTTLVGYVNGVEGV